MTETEEELIERQLKVIIVGEPATGKVRIFMRIKCESSWYTAYSFIYTVPNK